MAGRGFLLFFACVASIVLASAAPVRNDADCVSSQLLQVSGLNVYPTTHQIQSTKVTSVQDKTTIQVAQNFEVTYYSTFKVLTNLYTYANESYVLYQCGTTPPDVTQYGLPASTKMFAVPLRSVSVTDTSVLTFMKLLGVESRVSYVTPYAVDPCMQQLASSACNHTDSAATSATVDARLGGFSVNSKDPLAITFTATADPGPLNRAEYIKYLAVLFNRESVANAQFNSLVAAYDNIRQQAASYKSKTNATSPLVAWLYYSPAYPSYGLPEQVDLQFAAYRKQYTEDAGGRLHNPAQLAAAYGDGANVTLAAGGTQLRFTNLSSSLAVLQRILKDVDVVIDESYSANPAGYTLSDFLARYGLTNAPTTELRFLANQRLLRLDGSASPGGFTAWYEEAVARPDEVLRDLVSALLPGALLAAGDSSAPRLVRSVFASNPGRVVTATAGECGLTAGQQCGAAAAITPICPAVYIACNGSLVAATAEQPCAPASCPVPVVSTPSPSPVGSSAAAARPLSAPLLLLAALLCAMMVVMGGANWAL
ncbi:hypothetical protein Agub_g11420 [Astrephomene gubernaculifera]|uniref:Uncharacterized protein n=1 Tax=Astrephomene gubernaculifera TaxID=47775 RepID=A0AAD3DWS4_9CHLO|nr:hypothetical protein Agub_g11420 [Astrephomene gubernaculifera]